MRVGKHPPHLPGPLRTLCCWSCGIRKILIPESSSCRNHCRGSSSLGVPQSRWIIDALSPNHSLLRARLTQRAALKKNEPWKTVCPAPVYMDTYRGAGAFSNHGICRLWAPCFACSPALRVRHCRPHPKGDRDELANMCEGDQRSCNMEL